LEGEVEGVERLAGREVGGLAAALQQALVTGLGLDGQRPVEEGLVGDLLLAGLIEQRGQGLAEVA